MRNDVSLAVVLLLVVTGSVSAGETGENGGVLEAVRAVSEKGPTIEFWDDAWIRFGLRAQFRYEHDSGSGSSTARSFATV